jgi:hypothetical protein
MAGNLVQVDSVTNGVVVALNSITGKYGPVVSGAGDPCCCAPANGCNVCGTTITGATVTFSSATLIATGCYFGHTLGGNINGTYDIAIPTPSTCGAGIDTSALMFDSQAVFLSVSIGVAGSNIGVVVTIIGTFASNPSLMYTLWRGAVTVSCSTALSTTLTLTYNYGECASGPSTPAANIFSGEVVQVTLWH